MSRRGDRSYPSRPTPIAIVNWMILFRCKLHLRALSMARSMPVSFFKRPLENRVAMEKKEKKGRKEESFVFIPLFFPHRGTRIFLIKMLHHMSPRLGKIFFSRDFFFRSFARFAIYEVFLIVCWKWIYGMEIIYRWVSCVFFKNVVMFNVFGTLDGTLLDVNLKLGDGETNSSIRGSCLLQLIIFNLCGLTDLIVSPTNPIYHSFELYKDLEYAQLIVVENWITFVFIIILFH